MVALVPDTLVILFVFRREVCMPWKCIRSWREHLCFVVASSTRRPTDVCRESAAWMVLVAGTRMSPGWSWGEMLRVADRPGLSGQ